MTAKPNILLLVLDSMRSDRVSCYGHDRETTPNLDEFASQATRYTNAYTPAPWTLPTHISLFTGLFPSEHGITNAFPDSNLQLSEDISTLADKLHDKGYRTGGFSNNPWVGKTSNLNRGFDDYVEWNLEIGSESESEIHSRTDRLLSRFHSLVGHAARQPVYILKRPFFTSSLTRRASSWIDSAVEGNEPWFCFMNLMEAHSPYFPPKSAFRKLGLDTPGPIEPRVLNTKLLAHIMGKTGLDSQTRDRVLEFCDASLRYQDQKVSELLDSLKRKGIFDNTLIIICSDHGKTLGDFDRSASPPHYLRDINIRVPLIVKEPNQQDGKVIDSPVELVSTHEYIMDGGSQPLKSYQPNSEYALFQDYIPHSRRKRDGQDTTFWWGIGATNKKLIRSDANETYLFKGQGVDERIIESTESKDCQAIKNMLSERLESLKDPRVVKEGGQLKDLESDVQSQLKDLGYLE
ncbi:sulfatase [Halovenus sp. HT40]|uniref:sulfatase n=1 Tax=Halovenus sp. HT40 TaxID=3126691 RepID=UPI00300EBDEA